MNNKKIKLEGRESIENLTKRDKQTIRFLKWVRRYPGWWYLICTQGKELERGCNNGFQRFIAESKPKLY